MSKGEILFHTLIRGKIIQKRGVTPLPCLSVFQDTEAWLESKRRVIDRLLSLEAKQQTPKARSPEAALQRWVPIRPLHLLPSLTLTELQLHK